MIRVELPGIRKELANLKKFADRKLRLKVLKKALRAAGRYIINTARRLVPVMSGNLRKSIKTKVKYYPKGDTLVVLIGVASYQETVFHGRKMVSHKYAHLVARGRKSFLQVFDVKPGKKYVVKGQSGILVLTNKSKHLIRIKRHLDAVKGVDFMADAVKIEQARAVRAASDVVEKELFKLNGSAA